MPRFGVVSVLVRSFQAVGAKRNEGGRVELNLKGAVVTILDKEKSQRVGYRILCACVCRRWRRYTWFYRRLGGKGMLTYSLFLF